MSNPSYTVDEQLAMDSAEARLTQEFDGIFDREAVDRFLHTSYEQLAAHAKIKTHLALLAERFARQRLRSLARVRGLRSTGLPVVLFLCIHNAGRSQMAQGFFNHLAGEKAVGLSGGSAPGSAVNPVAIEAMAERGIDISDAYPKPWTDEVVEAADVVVTMGCGDECPYFPGKRYIDWELTDPAGQGIDLVRGVRDEIEGRVRALLAELDVPVEATSGTANA